MSTVIVTAIEVLRVLEGHPVTFADDGNNSVVLRLGTPDELLAKHRLACETTGVEPSMTRDQAEALAKPLVLP